MTVLTEGTTSWNGIERAVYSPRQAVHLIDGADASRRAIAVADYHPLSDRRFAPAITALARLSNTEDKVTIDRFIHVHHLKALSEIGAEYRVDPVADLRPVCPNCHAVIHLGGQTRTIEDIRKFLESTGRADNGR